MLDGVGGCFAKLTTVFGVDMRCLQEGKGVIAAHSTKRVTICFTPESRMYYNVTISCKLTTGSEALETKVPGTNAGQQLLRPEDLEQLPQCNVLGNAVYPTLSVLVCLISTSHFAVPTHTTKDDECGCD